MKNRILLKNKGCLFLLLPKIYQLPEYYMMFAWKILYLPNLGEGKCHPVAPPPVSYAYASEWRLSLVSRRGASWTAVVIRCWQCWEQYSERWTLSPAEEWLCWRVVSVYTVRYTAATRLCSVLYRSAMAALAWLCWAVYLYHTHTHTRG